MNHIAIFASGSGTNAENIIQFFREDPDTNVSVVFCNRSGAGVIERAENLGIPVEIFDRSTFYETDQILSRLNTYSVNLIVLAGFLWLVPENILDAFPNRIMNIHPALLPDFGGKGMYGRRVHEAIILSGRKESGISIHLVNKEYDKGEILFQARCEVLQGDSPDDLAARIHQLEHRHFPKVIQDYLSRIKD